MRAANLKLAIPFSLVLLLCASPARAQGAQAQKLDAEIAELIEDCAKPSARVRKKLDKLLQSYDGQRTLLQTRRYPLERVAFHLAFAEADAEVDASKLITGKLVEWNERRGKISLRYGKTDRGDWQKANKGWMQHPVQFTGPFELSFEGRQYGGSGEVATLRIMQGSDGSAIVVQFGVSGAGSAYPPAIGISRPGAEKLEVIERGSISPCEARQPFHLRVKVLKGRVQAFVGRKRILQARVDKSRPFGQVMVSGFPWEEATLEGEVSPAWINGRVAEQRAKQLASFRQNTKRSDLLPEWLFEEPEISRDRRMTPMQLPELEGKALDALRNAVDLELRGELNTLAERLSTYRSQKLPGYLLDYYEGVVLRDKGKLPAALAQMEKTIRAQPSWMRAWNHAAQIEKELGRFDDAEKRLVGAFRRFGAGADIPEELMLSLLRNGSPAKVMELALELRKPGAIPAGSEKLAILERSAWLALYGGPLRFGEKRRRYDALELRYPADKTREARALAKEVQRFQKELFKALPELEPLAELPVTLALFASEATQQDFEGLMRSDDLGELISGNKIVPLRLQPKEEALHQKARFEWFAAALRQAFGGKLALLRSGLLCANDKAVLELWPQHGEALRKAAAQPPRLQIMWSDGMDLHREIFDAYAAHVIHHLATSSEENRAILTQLFERAKAGLRGGALLEAPLDPATCARLDQELRAKLGG